MARFHNLKIKDIRREKKTLARVYTLLNKKDAEAK